MTEARVKTATNVTRADDERIDTDAGTVEVVLVWRFLLEMPESGE